MLNKGSRTVICAVLIATLILTMSLPVSGFAAEGPAAGVSSTEPKAAAKAVSVSDEAGLIDAIANAGSGETIQIQKNIQLTKPLEIPEDKQLTLTGSAGAKLTIHMSEAAFKSAQQSYTSALLMVRGTLSLSGLTLDGGNHMRVMYIGAGGAVTLGSGAVLTGGALGKDSINWGAGVRMEGSRSKQASLTINDGASIRDNRALGKYYITGIGICNSRYGSIVMNGGTISGNKDMTTGTSRYFSYGGGVALDGAGASFTMNGGSISGNSAKAAGGGVYASAGKDGFVMNEGTITGNSTVASGGGLYVGGVSAVMNGGTISGNTAQSNTDQTGYASGGGVYIAGDSAKDGTATAHGTFILRGGAISANTAKTTAARNRYECQFGQGGGVMAAGIFRMEGGSVSGNSALSAQDIGGDAGCGGGVSIKGGTAPGSFVMTGGSVSANKASRCGGGVYMNNRDQEMDLLYPSLSEVTPYKGSGILSLRGDVRFADNTAADKASGIYLTKGSILTVAGALGSGVELSLDSESTVKETVVAQAGAGYSITEAEAGRIKSADGQALYGLKDGALVLLQGADPGTEPEPGTETDIAKAKISNIRSTYTLTVEREAGVIL